MALTESNANNIKKAIDTLKENGINVQWEVEQEAVMMEGYDEQFGYVDDVGGYAIDVRVRGYVPREDLRVYTKISNLKERGAKSE